MSAEVPIQASNIFAFNAAFNTQSSSEDSATNNKPQNDERGNVSCQRNVGEKTEYTQNLDYCGNDLISDLGEHLTEFGNVFGAGVLTQLVINMTAGEPCTIDASGHQHPVNPHLSDIYTGYADVGDFLPHEIGESFFGWDGFGVPDFGIATGTDATPSSATVTFTVEHKDSDQASGEHFTGKNITPRCELSLEFEGTPTSNTRTLIDFDMDSNVNAMLGAETDSIAKSDANAEFDTFGFVAHANPSIKLV